MKHQGCKRFSQPHPLQMFKIFLSQYLARDLHVFVRAYIFEICTAPVCPEDLISYGWGGGNVPPLRDTLKWFTGLVFETTLIKNLIGRADK